MGQRGPVRSPNSRRGQQEIRKRQQLAAVSVSHGAPAATVLNAPVELPTCDKCLPRRVQEIYQNLVIDLAGAKVPIKQIDSHAITMAARCLDSVEQAEKMAEDPEIPPDQRISALRLKAAFGKDLQRWLEMICATPGTRARIGLKPPDEKKGGRLAEMLAARARK